MPWSGSCARIALRTCLCAAALGAAASAQIRLSDPVKTTSAGSRDATLDEYRQHLIQLTVITQACAAARDMKSCDPALVENDDNVALPASPTPARRLIRYDWLRVLLLQGRIKEDEPQKPASKTDAKPAAKPDAKPDAATGRDQSGKDDKEPSKGQAAQGKDSGKDAADGDDDEDDEDESVPTVAGIASRGRSTADLLKDAVDRLTQDRAQADRLAGATPAYEKERAQVTAILARNEFKGINDTSIKNTILEKILNWLNRLLERAFSFGPRASWIGRTIFWTLLGAIFLGIVWGIIQMERRRRIRLIPDLLEPAPGAASARDWQLWLEDARKAAAEGRWRDAVHFVYWASISRLESKRLWPADRARTPREYLALVAEEDPRKAGLKSLTGSFERIWYGGREAGEVEYRDAEHLAQSLIEMGGAARGGAR